MMTQEQIRDEFEKLSYALSKIEKHPKIHEFDDKYLAALTNHWHSLAYIMEIPAYILNGWDIKHTGFYGVDQLLEELERDGA